MGAINTTAKAVRLELWRERLRQCAPSHQCWRTPPSWRRLPLDDLEGTQPVAYTGWPVKSEHVKSGDIQTKQRLVTVALGRPCPTMNTACSTQYLTTDNGIAIGCARHWEGTIWEMWLMEGHDRMMMMSLESGCIGWTCYMFTSVVDDGDTPHLR